MFSSATRLASDLARLPAPVSLPQQGDRVPTWAQAAPAISTQTLLTGETANNSFGQLVSSAGDVNGDGYADGIVGAYGYSTSAGRACVYYGGPGADNVADLVLTGGAAGDNFGYSRKEDSHACSNRLHRGS